MFEQNFKKHIIFDIKYTYMDLRKIF